MGEKWEVRTTDLDEDAAHRRYKTFKESTYDSLTTLREVFHYHFINAHGTVIEVQQRIIRELKYQSSLELDEATYDRISSIPLAEKLSLHARQLLVHRLDSYEKFHSELFECVVDLIKTKFIPIVEKHSISGLAYINSEDSAFDDPLAIAMLIDVFTGVVLLPWLISVKWKYLQGLILKPTKSLIGLKKYLGFALTLTGLRFVEAYKFKISYGYKISNSCRKYCFAFD